MPERFQLVSDFTPQGDQPRAIAELVAGIQAGAQHQTLLGVTGSGKSFTMACVVEALNRPALVMAGRFHARQGFLNPDMHLSYPPPATMFRPASARSRLNSSFMQTILRIFFGAKDTRPILVLSLLLLAGLAEIGGMGTLLPVATSIAGGVTAGSSPLNGIILSYLQQVGIAPSIGNLIAIIFDIPVPAGYPDIFRAHLRRRFRGQSSGQPAPRLDRWCLRRALEFLCQPKWRTVGHRNQQ